LRKALTFYPNYSLLHFYLADVSRRHGDVQTAEKEYTHAIEIDRELYPAYYELALLRHTRGEHATAIQLLETAIILNPYNREAYQALATIYIDIGDFAAADHVYQRQRTVEEHTVE
jgi:Tfp pilus assembly protein PilF